MFTAIVQYNLKTVIIWTGIPSFTQSMDLRCDLDKERLGYEKSSRPKCLQFQYILQSLAIIKITFYSQHQAKISIPVSHKEKEEEPAVVFIGHWLEAATNVFF